MSQDPKTVVRRFVEEFQTQKPGKHWNQVDQFGLMQRLGVVPTSG